MKRTSIVINLLAVGCLSFSFAVFAQNDSSISHAYIYNFGTNQYTYTDLSTLPKGAQLTPWEYKGELEYKGTRIFIITGHAPVPRVGVPPLPAAPKTLPDSKQKIVVPNPLAPKIITPSPIYAPQQAVRAVLKDPILVVFFDLKKKSPYSDGWTRVPANPWEFNNLLDQAKVHKMYYYKQVLHDDGTPFIENGRIVYRRFNNPFYKPKPNFDRVLFPGFWEMIFGN